MKLIISLTALAFLSLKAADALELAGVNLIGLAADASLLGTAYTEFTSTSCGGEQTSYPYPDPLELYIAWRELRFNLVLLSVAWGHIQTGLNGPLNETTLAGLDNLVDFITGNGSTVILDILMNESWGLSALKWASTMKRAIKAILSQAPSHRILVAGPYAATVTTWELRSALALLPLLETAPKGQIIFDLHQHFDIPNGRTNDCLSWGLFYLPFKTVTETLRGRGATAMLTEIGGGPNDACAKSLGEVLGFFEQNSDVWIGWTAWSNMYGDQAISPNVSSEYYVLTGVMRKFAPLGVSGM